jgi:hypothetical protein
MGSRTHNGSIRYTRKFCWWGAPGRSSDAPPDLSRSAT